MNSTTAAATNRLDPVKESVWFSNARIQVIAIIAVSAALKLAISPLVGLGTNEAYAIASGRAMSLSYFDHPPLHFWLAHFCELLFGDGSAARIPFILMGAATSWMMFALTRRLFGDRAGVWATLAINLSIFFNLVSGNWILPDGPLNLFLLTTAFILAPTAQGRTLDLKSWMAAGLFGGLAALSKYHAFLFLAGFFCFLIVDRNRRRALLTAGPWLAAVITLTVFSPVLIWNSSNDWVSFHFQSGRVVPHHLGIGLFLSLLSAQIVVLLPGALFPLVAGARRAFSSRKSEELFVLSLGLPIIVLFTLIPLATDNGMMHWAMPGWLMLMPLAGKFLDEQSQTASWPARAMSVGAAVLAAGAIAAALEFQSGWLGAEYPGLFKHGDPTSENANWAPLAAAFPTRADANRNFIVTPEWRNAAKIDEALGGKYRVIVDSNDPRNFAVGLNLAAFAGRNGWIVLRIPEHAAVIDSMHHCFQHSQHIANVIVARNERPDASLILFRADDFQPDRCKLIAFSD